MKIFLAMTVCLFGLGFTTPHANAQQRGQLITNQWYMNKIFTTNDCEGFIQQSGTSKQAIAWAQNEVQPKYPVKAYQIIYTSLDHTGRQIPVSGVVLVPQVATNMQLPLLVYQHATILENNSAPSFVTNSGQTKALMSVFAASGYVVAMSDFVGTGLVTNYSSEYLFAGSEATNGVDVITATKTLLTTLNVQTNGKLFLSGYSEGGQAVSALADTLQSQDTNVPVTAAILMEGPYNMNYVVNNFLSNSVVLDNLPVGSLICAKAIYAYNGIYSWRGMGSIFKWPYATRVLNNFSLPNPELLKLAFLFPRSTSTMFKPSFLKNATTGSVGTNIASNNTDGWIPTKFPVLILTSLADTLIPPEVAIDTYNKMLDAGSTNVRFDHSIFPLNHLQNFFPSIVQSKLIFDQY